MCVATARDRCRRRFLIGRKTEEQAWRFQGLRFVVRRASMEELPFVRTSIRLRTTQNGNASIKALRTTHLNPSLQTQIDHRTYETLP